MQTKTVTISEVAYNRITSMKKEDETISDVIIRLCEEPEEPELISFLKNITEEERLSIADAVLQSKKELDQGFLRTF